MPRRKYDRVAFVKAWLESKTIADVVAKVGMTDGAVRALAAAMRAKGVKLPKLTRGADVDALNKIIADSELKP